MKDNEKDDDIRVKRLEFLLALYDKCKGDPTKHIHIELIRKEMSFTKEETRGIIEYLARKELIERLGPVCIFITTNGIDEAEQEKDHVKKWIHLNEI